MNLSFQLSFGSESSVGEPLVEDSSTAGLAMTSISPSLSSIGGSVPGVIGVFFGVFGRAVDVGLSSVISNCGDIRLKEIVAIAA